MKESLESTIILDQVIDDLSFAKIVGHFWINNHQYLVIQVECDGNLINRPDSALLNIDLSKCRQFELDGQHCMVIAANSHFSISQSNALSLLTERELQIVKLVALGYPNKKIAKQLHISEWTVSTHLRRVFAKLGVDSRAAMVHRCAVLLN